MRQGQGESSGAMVPTSRGAEQGAHGALGRWEQSHVVPGSCKAWRSRLHREAGAGCGGPQVLGSVLGVDSTGSREPAAVAERWGR